jgi:hypothetical protein
MQDSVTKVSAGVSALLPWPVWRRPLPSLVVLEEQMDYLIGFDSSSMLVESAPTMTVVLASVVLGLKIVEEQTNNLADYCGSYSSQNAQTMMGAELTIHSVQVNAAYAQQMIGAEMMVHSLQEDEFPTLSRAELQQ